MELKGQQRINAPRAKVYAALNDPEILKICIPGCNSLEKLSDTEMSATITMKVGPVKAKFTGEVTLSNLNPPEGYTITGRGKAGPAGHAKGGADVALQEEADGSTLLIYTVKADVGGKIAQLGSRLMDSTAKKLAGQFFEKFAELVDVQEEVTAPDTPQATEQAPLSSPASVTDVSPEKKSSTWLWGVAVVGAAAAIWYLTR